MRRWHNPDRGLLILRLAIGLIFLAHGWTKIFGSQVSFVHEMLHMAGWSIPEPILWLVAVLELLGGIALLLGVFTRPLALALALEMIVAVILFHAKQGFFISSLPNAPLAYGFEYHVALVGGLLCLVLCGPGGWALEGRKETGLAEGA
ncbi:MAG: DoxX family protein [Gemmatimonadota bacterium]